MTGGGHILRPCRIGTGGWKFSFAGANLIRGVGIIAGKSKPMKHLKQQGLFERGQKMGLKTALGVSLK